MEMVELGTVNDPREIAELRGLIEDHAHWTHSAHAKRILKNFNRLLPSFVRVMPLDYKAVLEGEAAKAREEKQRLQIGGFADVKDDVSPLQDRPKTPANTGQEIPAAHVGQNEAPIVDLEDSMVDATAEKKKAEKLDKTRGFMKYQRLSEKYRNPRKRVKDWSELSTRLTDSELKVQAARCMDCGVPFCQSDSGCPISNIIPRWNDLVFKGQWKDALNRLLMTNNFPEFTGRVCPAPCEGACVLGINEAPVGIKSIECAIIDKAWEEGWMVPRPPAHRSGKRVAVIGSGPAGLSCADQLNKAGHSVTVYDRNDRFGGLLMYGIPNMKLDKKVVQRRLDLMADEGVEFINNTHVGVDIDAQELRSQYDAIVMSTGATWPRNLSIKNREANGIHFAMELLTQNTRSLLDSNHEDGRYINAKGKNVIVIGGGDTGNDCIGTSMRHGAKSVVNFELLPQPPSARGSDNPWPTWPRIFRVDYGHTEVASHFGKDPREYCISTKDFTMDDEGNLTGLHTVRVEWTKDHSGAWKMAEVPNSQEFFPAELCLLALGFLGPEESAIKTLGIEQDGRSNIKTAKGKYATNVEGVFAAGDCRRGQSLIVWGIQEGRAAAVDVDTYLSNEASRLPSAGSLTRRSMAATRFAPQIEKPQQDITVGA